MKTAIDRLREYRARQDTKPQDMPLPGHLRSGEGSLERRFGPRAAELYPHLGKTVQTPEGGAGCGRCSRCGLELSWRHLRNGSRSLDRMRSGHAMTRMGRGRGGQSDEGSDGCSKATNAIDTPQTSGCHNCTSSWVEGKATQDSGLFKLDHDRQPGCVSTGR